MFTKQAPAEDSRSVTMVSMKPPQLVLNWIIAERFHAFHLRSSRPIYQVRSDNGPDETSAPIKFDGGGTTQDKPLATIRPYEMKLLFY